VAGFLPAALCRLAAERSRRCNFCRRALRSVRRPDQRIAFPFACRLCSTARAARKTNAALAIIIRTAGLPTASPALLLLDIFFVREEGTAGGRQAGPRFCHLHLKVLLGLLRVLVVVPLESSRPAAASICNYHACGRHA